MKRFRTLYIILLSILQICISSLIWYLYTTGSQSISMKAEDALRFAVEAEFDKRFSELNIPFSVSSLKSEYKNIEIISESGQVAMQVDSARKEKVISTLTERKIRYTIASRIQKCNLSYIDSLWQVQLSTHDIKANTAICLFSAVSDTDTVSEKCHNNYLLNKRTFFYTYYAGVGNEIQLDTYIDYSFPTALKSGTWNGFSFMLMLMISGILFFMVANNIKLRKSDEYILPIHSENPFNEETIYDMPIYHLGNVTFHSHDRKLISGKIEIELRQQLCDILLLLLHAPDYHMKSTDILVEIWGNDTEIGIQDRLYKNISDL